MQLNQLLKLASSQAQSVGAGSIANGNTPGYAAKNAEPFQAVLESLGAQQSATHASHDSTTQANGSAPVVSIASTSGSPSLEQEPMNAGEIRRAYELLTGLQRLVEGSGPRAFTGAVDPLSMPLTQRALPQYQQQYFSTLDPFTPGQFGTISEDNPYGFPELGTEVPGHREVWGREGQPVFSTDLAGLGLDFHNSFDLSPFVNDWQVQPGALPNLDEPTTGNLYITNRDDSQLTSPFDPKRQTENTTITSGVQPNNWAGTFATYRASDDNARWVDSMYQQHAGRHAEQAGMDYWLGEFAKGRSQADIQADMLAAFGDPSLQAQSDLIKAEQQAKLTAHSDARSAYNDFYRPTATASI